jgi:hypothetical protein
LDISILETEDNTEESNIQQSEEISFRQEAALRKRITTQTKILVKRIEYRSTLQQEISKNKIEVDNQVEKNQVDNNQKEDRQAEIQANNQEENQIQAISLWKHKYL